MNERHSEAAEFLAKQESELHDFLFRQADKLHSAGCDWQLPEGYSEDVLGFFVMSDAALNGSNLGEGAVVLQSNGRVVSVKKATGIKEPLVESKIKTILEIIVSQVESKVSELRQEVRV